MKPSFFGNPPVAWSAHATRRWTDPFSISTPVDQLNHGMSDRIDAGVDVGGTFTDAVVVGPTGSATAKVPTTTPPHGGVMEGLERACQSAGIECRSVDRFRHGSTVATNALLERNGATTALVTTSGFRDVLEIGRQDRPSLYDLAAERPPPLIPRSRRYTIEERTPPPGHPEPGGVRVRPDPADIKALGNNLSDIEAVAVCLLHSDVDPRHERLVVDQLQSTLDVPIVASHEIDPQVREYERTATTVASAYLTPVMQTYLERLVAACDAAGVKRPQIMQSSGGIADPEQLAQRAAAGVLSGPAAGVVGATKTATGAVSDAAGYITLDMGGTSADVGRVVDGEPTITTECTVADRPIRLPAVDIHTVGAGGGSIGWVDAGGALRVGPQSAGADPGPACYGRGGTEATVTDAAIELGLIGPERRLGDTVSVDAESTQTALAELADAAGIDGPTAAAAGIYRVAIETMTQAIRHVTIERGIDPRDDALVAYGGAGGMVAAAIADRLEIEQVVLPPHAGLASAVGLVVADERQDAGTGIHRPLDAAIDDGLEETFRQLESTVRTRCTDPAAAMISRSAALRYAGQSHELTIPIESPLHHDDIVDRFETHHDRRHGYTLDDRVELITARVQAVVETATPTLSIGSAPTTPKRTREARVPPGTSREFAVYEEIPETALGPCVIERPNTTIVVPTAWRLDATGGVISLRRGADT